MFCEKCGTKNEDGANFCVGCGTRIGGYVMPVQDTPVQDIPVQNTPIQDIPVQTAPQNNNEFQSQYAEAYSSGENASYNESVLPQDSMQPQMYNQEPAAVKAKKPKGKKIAIIASIAAVLVIGIVVTLILVLTKKTSIDLNDYVVVELNGYDGYGSANAYIDWSRLEQDYGSKLKFSSDAKKQLGTSVMYTTPTDKLRYYVDFSLSKTSKLTNDEVILYQWEVDEEYSEWINCELEFIDAEYTVSGLIPVGKFDAFKDLEVTFYGVAPGGNVKLEYFGDRFSYYDFYCDKTYDLSNGDVVTISLDDNYVEYYAENWGEVPETFSKEYTVTGLDSYVTDIDDISKDAVESMKSQAEDVITSYVAGWSDDIELIGVTYVGDYFMTQKGTNEYNKNWYGLVYVVTSYIQPSTSYDPVFCTMYYDVQFKNILTNDLGECTVDILDYYTTNNRFTVEAKYGDSIWDYNTYYYYGYENLSDLKKSHYDSSMDSYSGVWNVEGEAEAEPVEVEVDDAKTDSGMIFPNSDKELITSEELEGLTAEECRIARNEIYARHGRKFQTEEVQAYFDALDWYEGTIEPGDFDETMLNEIEVANKDLIVEYEEKMGYR